MSTSHADFTPQPLPANAGRGEDAARVRQQAAWLLRLPPAPPMGTSTTKAAYPPPTELRPFVLTVGKHFSCLANALRASPCR
jgi:hypothetical protein